MQAFADHGEVKGDQVTGRADEAREVIVALEALGISYDDVVQALEDEGVDKFDKFWAELVETVQGALDGAKPPRGQFDGPMCLVARRRLGPRQDGEYPGDMVTEFPHVVPEEGGGGVIQDLTVTVEPFWRVVDVSLR